MTDISSDSFYRCDSLSVIEINTNNPIYHSKGNCIIETSSKRLIYGCKNSVIPRDGSVETIAASAFYNCNYLTEITIPDSVKIIERSAFYSCDNLTSVIVGNGVREIGYWAFKDCQKLSYISLGTSVEVIGTEVFYECYDLTSIVMPYSLKRIEKAAFQCTSLEIMFLSNSVEYFGEMAFCLCDFGEIYFEGTKAEWNAIEKGTGWNSYWTSYVIHCSNGDISSSW